MGKMPNALKKWLMVTILTVRTSDNVTEISVDKLVENDCHGNERGPRFLRQSPAPAGTWPTAGVVLPRLSICLREERIHLSQVASNLPDEETSEILKAECQNSRATRGK